MKTIQKILPALSALIFVLVLFGGIVSADAGPKPSVTVIVENIQGDVYYLDLLIPYKGDYSNINEDERDDYDKDMLAVLENYSEDGWYAALAGGTNAPLFGDLTGEAADGEARHRFSYIIPDRFKVIIVTSDLDVRISDEIIPKSFNESIYMDYKTMALRRIDPGIMSYIKQFAGTFLPTIIIEGFLLLIFGFSLKKNWKVFILLNLLTQILLSAAMAVILINFGLMASYFVFIPAEMVIILIEAIVLTKMLKEHRSSRRLIYALVANLASAAAGFFLVPTWFDMIFK